MARAMGRSVSTERMHFEKRQVKRVEEVRQEVEAGPLHRRLGAVALEVLLIALVGVGIGASAIHVVKPEASCASCAVEAVTR